MSYAYLFKYIIIGDTGKIWKDNFETTKVMENFANKKKCLRYWKKSQSNWRIMKSLWKHMEAK